MRNIRMKELATIIGVCRYTIYKWIDAGIFPPPLRIGNAAKGWPDDVIDKWLHDREFVARRPKSVGTVSTSSSEIKKCA